MAASYVLQQLHTRLQLPSASCSSGSTSVPSPSFNCRQAVSLTATKAVVRPMTASGIASSPVAIPGFQNWRTSGRDGLRPAVWCGAIGNTVESSIRYSAVQERQVSTLYEVLGVSHEATDTDLKLAFRCMAKKYHPDHAPPEAVSEYQDKFLELRRAYDVLKDPRSRALYDFEIKNSPKYWAQKFDLKHRQWRGRNWETDQCWTS